MGSKWKRKKRRKPKVGPKHQAQLREFAKERPLTMVVEEGNVDFDGSHYAGKKRFYIVALRGRLADLSKKSADKALHKIAQEECPYPTNVEDDNHFRFTNSRIAVRERTEEDEELLKQYAGQVVKDEATTAVVTKAAAAMDEDDRTSGRSGRYGVKKIEAEDE